MIFMFSANSSLFDQKVRKSRFSPKYALLDSKVRKVRIFMKITKKRTFSLFSRPLRKCCSSTRNIDGFGSTFLVLERKVLIFEIFMKSAFSHFWVQKRTFLTFEPKSRFTAPKVPFGAKVRFGSSGSPRRGPGTAPDGSPEGASPGTPPNPARARKRLKLKLNSKSDSVINISIINNSGV